MEYKKIGETYYIRMDRDDEVIENILDVCRKESIPSAIFSGIGGCGSAKLQVFIPETGAFPFLIQEGWSAWNGWRASERNNRSLYG
jgi:predicted DNA-binding protein with PD1-like motif